MSKVTDSTLSVVAVLAALLFIAKTGMSADMPATGEVHSSRQEFAKRSIQISENMPAAQVEALLGKPDYVGHFDPRFFPACPTVWFYGCIGPYRFASLGSVSFSHEGLVTYCNRNEPPPVESVISEVELRNALWLLDQVPAYDATNPGAFIRVVNELLPLGKAKILAALAEYRNFIKPDQRPDQSLEWNQPPPTDPGSRDALFIASRNPHSKSDALLFLTRVLFDIPATTNAPPGETKPFGYPMIGRTSPPAPFDTTISPRFPVTLIGDIPILEIVVASGLDVPVLEDRETPLLEKYGRLRTKLLRPTDHPEDILNYLEASPQWFFGRRYRIYQGNGFGSNKPVFKEHSDSLEEQVRASVKGQILKLLAPLYPKLFSFKPSFTQNGKAFRIDVDISQWNAIMADLKAHPVRWNPTTNEYERRGD